MKKKGAIFTLLSLVMVSILFLLAQTNLSEPVQSSSYVVHDRIDSTNYFIQDLERDIKRSTKIATHRGLLGIQQQVTSEGNYLHELDEAFNEMIVNGTYNNTYLSIMNNTELKTWFKRINQEANKLSIHVDYRIQNVSVEHTNPWEISIRMGIVLNVSDKAGGAYWNRDKVIESNLSIIDFEDPLYNVKTKGRIVNTIEPTNITNFIDGENTSGLVEHVDGRYYIENNASPSFLMRLEGNLSSSPHGIESFVDLRRLEDMGISTKEKSTIDHIYFSEQDPQNWVINNTYSWLRIDNQTGRLEDYNITEEELLI